MSTLGFIGLGAMGSRIAARLIANGSQLGGAALAGSPPVRVARLSYCSRDSRGMIAPGLYWAVNPRVGCRAG